MSQLANQPTMHLLVKERGDVKGGGYKLVDERQLIYFTCSNFVSPSFGQIFEAKLKGDDVNKIYLAILLPSHIKYELFEKLVVDGDYKQHALNLELLYKIICDRNYQQYPLLKDRHHFLNHNTLDCLNFIKSSPWWYLEKIYNAIHQSSLLECPQLNLLFFEAFVLKSGESYSRFDCPLYHYENIFAASKISQISYDQIKRLIPGFDINIQREYIQRNIDINKNRQCKSYSEYITAKNGFDLCLIPRSHLHDIFSEILDTLNGDNQIRNDPAILRDRFREFKRYPIGYDFRLSHANDKDDDDEAAAGLGITPHTLPLWSWNNVHNLIKKSAGVLCGAKICNYIIDLAMVYIDAHPNVFFLKDTNVNLTKLSDRAANFLKRRQINWSNDGKEVRYIISSNEGNALVRKRNPEYSSVLSSRSDENVGTFKIDIDGNKKTWFESFINNNNEFPIYVVMSYIEYATLLVYSKVMYNVKRDFNYQIVNYHRYSENYLHQTLVDNCENIARKKYTTCNADYIKYFKRLRRVVDEYKNMELVDVVNTNMGQALAKIRYQKQTRENKDHDTDNLISPTQNDLHLFSNEKKMSLLRDDAAAHNNNTSSSNSINSKEIEIKEEEYDDDDDYYYDSDALVIDEEALCDDDDDDYHHRPSSSNERDKEGEEEKEQQQQQQQQQQEQKEEEEEEINNNNNNKKKNDDDDDKNLVKKQLEIKTDQRWRWQQQQQQHNQQHQHHHHHHLQQQEQEQQQQLDTEKTSVTKSSSTTIIIPSLPPPQHGDVLTKRGEEEEEEEILMMKRSRRSICSCSCIDNSSRSDRSSSSSSDFIKLIDDKKTITDSTIQQQQQQKLPFKKRNNYFYRPWMYTEDHDDDDGSIIYENKTDAHAREENNKNQRNSATTTTAAFATEDDDEKTKSLREYNYDDEEKEKKMMILLLPENCHATTTTKEKRKANDNNFLEGPIAKRTRSKSIKLL